MHFPRRIEHDYWARLGFALLMKNRDRLDWGIVRRIAERNGVTCAFLYRNEKFFERLFAKLDKPQTVAPGIDVHRLILSARLDCNSSIDGLMRMLVNMGCRPCSSGYVSEFLRSTSKVCKDEIPCKGKAIVLMLDEIFCNGVPIFVVLEAASHYILSIKLMPDRKKETWEDELRRLQEAGVEIMMVVKDQGSSLKAAAKALGLKERADLFHLLHPFDFYLAHLERHAYGAIEYEFERARVFGGRKSVQALEKCLAAYDAACLETLQAMRACDNYNLLHLWLHEAFDSFTATGSARTRETAEGDIQAVLNLMENEFAHHANTLDAVKSLRAALPDFLDYFDQLATIIAGQPKTIAEHTLRAVCLAWQLEKKAMAVKNPALKKMLGRQACDQRTLALAGANETLETAVRELLEALDSNVRSSSPLEAINSIIRRYLDACRGMTTQGALDMLAFYLNHKDATRGKYKGTSPHRRLTGLAEKDTPVKLILQRLSQAAKKQPELLEKPLQQSALSAVA